MIAIIRTVYTTIFCFYLDCHFRYDTRMVAILFSYRRIVMILIIIISWQSQTYRILYPHTHPIRCYRARVIFRGQSPKINKIKVFSDLYERWRVSITMSKQPHFTEFIEHRSHPWFVCSYHTCMPIIIFAAIRKYEYYY